jgi:hypothetical protein
VKTAGDFLNAGQPFQGRFADVVSVDIERDLRSGGFIRPGAGRLSPKEHCRHDR